MPIEQKIDTDMTLNKNFPEPFPSLKRSSELCPKWDPILYLRSWEWVSHSWMCGIKSMGSTSRFFLKSSVSVLYELLKPICDCIWQLPLTGKQRERSKVPTKRGECSIYMLEKGGFCLKTLAIIFHYSPCGLLHCFDLSQKKKNQRMG